MTKWQSIDTAPKDGTEIIGCFIGLWGYENEHITKYGPFTIAWNGRVWAPSWDDSEVLESVTDFGSSYKDTPLQPTHWIPMPKMPSREEFIRDYK